MKKLIQLSILSALLLALCCPVSAAGLSLAETETFSGMTLSYYQGYTPTVKNNTMTLCLPLRWDAAAGPITAVLSLDDPNAFLLKSEPKAVTVSPLDGLYPVRLTLSLEPSRRNGDYPATICVTGQDGSGAPVEESLSYVIRIRDGEANPETLRPAVSVSGEMEVGTESSLTLTVENPAATLSMTGVELTVTDAAGDLQMSGSNRLPLPEILPGQRAEISVPMLVKGSAAVEPHSLTVTLSYQVLGQSQTWEERFTLPVNQEIRLEPGSLDVSSTATLGELTTLTLPLMNMGRGQVVNAMVTLEMEGVTPRQSVLVGTLEAGQSAQAKLTFTPAALGSYSGSVIVSCEDDYGNESSFTLPVSLTVEAAQSAALPVEPDATAPPAWITPTLIVLCCLLAAALIFQGSWLRGKLHKLEEDRL